MNETEEKLAVQWGDATLFLPVTQSQAVETIEGFQPIRIERVSIPTQEVLNRLVPFFLLFFVSVLILLGVKKG